MVIKKRAVKNFNFPTSLRGVYKSIKRINKPW